VAASARTRPSWSARLVRHQPLTTLRSGSTPVNEMVLDTASATVETTVESQLSTTVSEGRSEVQSVGWRKLVRYRS